MIAYNKTMYHFHVHNEYDPLWKKDNEIIVDRKFNIGRQFFIKNFSTGVFCINPDGIRPIDEVIRLLLEHINTEEKVLELKEMDKAAYLYNMRNIINLLKDSSEIIKYASIFNLEKAMEDVRERYYSPIPSRLNSMFVIDDNSIETWANSYKELDADLYELSLTGNLFKTSAAFTPPLGETYLDSTRLSHAYWNPKIKTQKEIEYTEYLFNGKVKILRKINKEI